MVERMNLTGREDLEEIMFMGQLDNLRKHVNIERTGKKVTIEFLGAKTKEGKNALFEVKMKDNRNFSFKEVFTCWFQQYHETKKEEKVLGKNAKLVISETGKPTVVYLDDLNDKEFEIVKDERGFNVNYTGTEIILNPKEERVKNLYGKHVLATDCAWDFDNTQVKGTLVSIVTDMAQSHGKPFVVELKDGTQQNFFCIKEQPEPTYQPYKLANADVRDKLMLKVYKSKDSKTYVEQMIHTFKCTGGSWTVNGMSAAHLLQNYTWLNGEPCGEMPEE